MWIEEVDNVLIYIGIVNDRARRRRLTAISTYTDRLMKQNLETCVSKTLNGDVRTGHRVLKSDGLHRACDATVDLLKNKFVTNFANDTIATNLDLKKKAKLCKLAKISEKILGKLIGNLKDCKASGGSGWRNFETQSYCDDS